MSSPLTPFQARHQHSARSLGGVYNALEVPQASTFPVDDISLTSKVGRIHLRLISHDVTFFVTMVLLYCDQLRLMCNEM